MKNTLKNKQRAAGKRLSTRKQPKQLKYEDQIGQTLQYGYGRNKNSAQRYSQEESCGCG
jgi:hypothetical protein